MEKEQQTEMSRQPIFKKLQAANVCDQTLKEGQTCPLKSRNILGLR